MLFCVLAVLYFCIDSSLAADEAIVVGEVYIYNDRWFAWPALRPRDAHVARLCPQH